MHISNFNFFNSILIFLSFIPGSNFWPKKIFLFKEVFLCLIKYIFWIELNLFFICLLKFLINFIAKFLGFFIFFVLLIFLSFFNFLNCFNKNLFLFISWNFLSIFVSLILLFMFSSYFMKLINKNLIVW